MIPVFGIIFFMLYSDEFNFGLLYKVSMFIKSSLRWLQRKKLLHELV